MNDKKKVHNSQLCMKLEPVFTRGYRDGVQITDEPTGALNRSHTEEVLNLFTALHDSGQSILMVTHDLKAAVRGNRILYLEDGKVLAELTLPRYQAAEERQREHKLRDWLSGLQW